MQTKTNPIPTGYHTITPYVSVKDAKAFMQFVQKAFGAKVESSTEMPDGTIMHAGCLIGNSHLMVSEAQEAWGGPRNAQIYLYVENADNIYKQATAAGAKSIMEVTDQFYGDRMGCVADQWGNTWNIASHVEDVSSEEIQKRFQDMVASGKMNCGSQQ